MSKNLFIGSLSWNVDEDWLGEEFQKHGELQGVRIITDQNTGRSKGYGYVEFVNLDDAVKAYEAMKGTEIDGRAINLDYAKPRPEGNQNNHQARAKSFGDQLSAPSDTLWVGNISFDATVDMISEAFGEHGELSGVRVPTDPESGAIKGFGYVQFTSVDDAQSAIDALQGANIAGRPVRIDFAQPRSNDGSSRGGRGGQRGGRGGSFGGGFGGRGGGRGGRGGGRGGRGDRRGGLSRGGSTNRSGFGDFKGTKMTF